LGEVVPWGCGEERSLTVASLLRLAGRIEVGAEIGPRTDLWLAWEVGGVCTAARRASLP
jgi:hypothetical protein